MGITLGFNDSCVTGLVVNDSDFYPYVTKKLQ